MDTSTATPDYDVFVSYRWVSPDQEWVREQLVPALERSGLRVCLDVEDFVPGRDLILEMTRAGQTSRAVLAVLSPDYLEGNRMVRFEALAARRADPSGLHSKLIPLLLRETALPDWLRGLIPVNWTNERFQAREWRKLLGALGAPKLDGEPPVLPPDEGGFPHAPQSDANSVLSGLILGLEAHSEQAAAPGGSVRALRIAAKAIRDLVACATGLRAWIDGRVDFFNEPQAEQLFTIQECCGALGAIFENPDTDTNGRQVLQRWAEAVYLHPATIMTVEYLVRDTGGFRKWAKGRSDPHSVAAERFVVTLREIQSVETSLVRIAARFEAHAAMAREFGSSE